jgi:hypothetical protein
MGEKRSEFKSAEMSDERLADLLTMGTGEYADTDPRVRVALAELRLREHRAMLRQAEAAERTAVAAERAAVAAEEQAGAAKRGADASERGAAAAESGASATATYARYTFWILIAAAVTAAAAVIALFQRAC